MGNFRLEFYTDPSGRQPAREWMRSLSDPQRDAVGVALFAVLEQRGIGVCSDKYGRQLGGGLFELRIQEPASQILKDAGYPFRPDQAETRVSLRLFCHAHGDRIVLVLGGYDKLRDPSERRQRREIKTARERLTTFRSSRSSLGLDH